MYARSQSTGLWHEVIIYGSGDAMQLEINPVGLPSNPEVTVVEVEVPTVTGSVGTIPSSGSGIRPIPRISKTRTQLIIPAFSYPYVWSGVSEMLARYDVGNTREFSVKKPITEQESFVMAVKWTDGTLVYRYKLWDAGVLYFPVYNGERIGASAFFEVWTVVGQALAEQDNTIYDLSLFNTPSNSCYTCCENTQVNHLASYHTPVDGSPDNPFVT